MASEVYQLKIEGSLQGQYRQNILNFEGTGVDPLNTHSATLDLIGAFNTHLRGLWLAIMSQDYNITAVTTRRVSAKPSQTAHTIYQFGTFGGAVAAPATSQQLCPSVFMVPTMGSFSGGKIFLPCCPQGEASNNSFTAGWVTTINAFMAAATAGVAGSLYTWLLGVWHRKLGTFSPVASYHMSPFMGYQDKRKLQSGRPRKHKKKP